MLALKGQGGASHEKDPLMAVAGARPALAHPASSCPPSLSSPTMAGGQGPAGRLPVGPNGPHCLDGAAAGTASVSCQPRLRQARGPVRPGRREIAWDREWLGEAPGAVTGQRGPAGTWPWTSEGPRLAGTPVPAPREPSNLRQSTVFTGPLLIPLENGTSNRLLGELAVQDVERSPDSTVTELYPWINPLTACSARRWAGPYEASGKWGASRRMGVASGPLHLSGPLPVTFFLGLPWSFRPLVRCQVLREAFSGHQSAPDPFPPSSCLFFFFFFWKGCGWNPGPRTC